MLTDYSKYKRVFAFGCSFTNWNYPTWADIVAKSCENAEFYNFGRGGAGNIFISSRITQANIKFNFDENDLILVMFSTPLREDRWIRGSWRPVGNIYNQSFYDKKFVKDYTDPVGLIIRDLTVTETAISYLNSLPCDTLMLRSVEFGHSEFTFKFDDFERYSDRIIQIYNSSSISKLPKSLLESSLSPLRECVFKMKHGEDYYDSHPWPIDYLNYLQSIGITLTENAIEYAKYANDFVENVVYLEDLYAEFPSISNINEKYEIF